MQSFIIGLALVKGRLTPEEAFIAARVEEDHNISEYGLVKGLYGHDVEIWALHKLLASVRTYLDLLNAPTQVIDA